MVAIFEMPRLPTPMAMRDPARTRAPNSRPLSCRKTSARTSGMERSGKCWRTGSMRGRGIVSGYLLARRFLVFLGRLGLLQWLGGELVLMLLHPHSRAVEDHAFRFEPEALL